MNAEITLTEEKTEFKFDELSERANVLFEIIQRGEKYFTASRPLTRTEFAAENLNFKG